MKQTDLYEAQLRSLLSPDPDGDIIAWLEHNVHSVPYSPIPGPFRIEHTPYLAEPLRALTDPEVRTIVAMGPVQSGKSMILELWSVFAPSRAPGPMLLLQDIDMNAQDWSKRRLKPLLEATPASQDRMRQDDNGGWSVVQYDRMTQWILGANNTRNLQRRSIKNLGGDECWLWPKGHMKEAMARLTAFNWQGKAVFVSQGGVVDDDFTDTFNGTDRREYMFACFGCGTRQAFEWEQIVYPPEAKKADGWDYDIIRQNTEYECKQCKLRYKDRNSVRAEMCKTATFVPLNSNAPKGRVGYHWNALCVPWGLSWGDLAVECIEAKEAMREGAEDTKRREFKQKRLALPWSDEPDFDGGEILPGEYNMSQEWEKEAAFIAGKIEAGPFTPEQIGTAGHVRLRFLTVDVQKDHMYYLVRAWAANGQSRLITWGIVKTWDEIRAVQLKIKVADGFTFLDSGHMTDEVYRICSLYGWHATKGSGQNEFPWKITDPSARSGVRMIFKPFSRPKPIATAGKCNLYQFSNLLFKDLLARLRKTGVHTYAADAGEEYTKQMNSEKRGTTPAGKPIWLLVGERANHLFDCEVLQLLPAQALRLIGRNRKKQEDKTEEEKAKDEKQVD